MSTDSNKTSFLSGIGVSLLIVAVLTFVGALVFRAGFVSFVDSYEKGYAYDKFSGTTTVLSRTGYFVINPIKTTIHTLDTRPFQVCINANARVLNCKLIQFNVEGLELFLSWHGRQDYEIRTGTNQDGTPYTTPFMDIMKSYAYDGSGKTYPFLTILKDMKPE